MAVTTADSSPKVEQRSVAAAPRYQAWIWQVTGLCVVLGVLLGFALRTQWHYRKSQLPAGAGRYATIIPFYMSLKQANDRLQTEVTELRQKGSQFENQLSSRSHSADLLNEQLQDVKLFAGLTAVKGPG